MIRFIGCGTGRCGTVALSKIVGVCDKIRCTHELAPLLPWEFDIHAYKKKFVNLNSCKGGSGDVAYGYLPYLETFIRDIPEVKIIILKRDRQEVVDSFVRWHKIRTHFPGFDYSNEFPKVGTDDMNDGAGRYWDLYYKEAARLDNIYDNIKIINSRCLLNRGGQDLILDFIGINPEDRRYIDNPKYNAT